MPPVCVGQGVRGELSAAGRHRQPDGLRWRNVCCARRGPSWSGLPDPLIVLGQDRAVLRANAAARAAFGADMPAVLRHPQLRAAIDRAIAGGRGGAADGRSAGAGAGAARAAGDGGGAGSPRRAAGVLAVLSDRSRERAVERMRADFVANASHELRTPLASLIGFIDTLRGPAADDPPAQARFLEIMAEQAERMNRLIDDLLSLSRIEITEHQPPAEQVDMQAWSSACWRACSFDIGSRRGVRLDLGAAGVCRACRAMPTSWSRWRRTCWTTR